MLSLDEAITRERQIAKEQRSHIGTWYSKIMGYDDEYIKKCEVCAEEHEQFAEWFEELKATKSSDIPIIHGKEELELHDKAIRNKAIDDFAILIKETLNHDWATTKISEQIIYNRLFDKCNEIAEQLKAGGKNE